MRSVSVAGLALFLPYLSASFLFYPIAAFRLAFDSLDRTIKLQKKTTIYLAILVCFLIIKAVQIEALELIIQVKYFTGLILFYFYFKRFSNDFRPEVALTWLLIFAVIEAVLFNATNVVDYLGNYPNSSSNNPYEQPYLGFYRRPFGIGVGYSQSSIFFISLTLLTVLRKSEFRERMQWLIVGFIPLLIYSSGVGFVVMWASLIFLFATPRVVFTATLLSALFYLLAFFILDFKSLGNTPLVKISPEYVSWLWSFKTGQLAEAFGPLTITELLFGSSYSDGRQVMVGQDFGAFELVYNWGLLGSILLCWFIASKLHRNNLLPMLPLLISLIHYSALFSFPGQVLAGYLLAYRANSD